MPVDRTITLLLSRVDDGPTLAEIEAMAERLGITVDEYATRALIAEFERDTETRGID